MVGVILEVVVVVVVCVVGGIGGGGGGGVSTAWPVVFMLSTEHRSIL